MGATAIVGCHTPWGTVGHLGQIDRGVDQGQDLGAQVHGRGPISSWFCDETPGFNQRVGGRSVDPFFFVGTNVLNMS